MNDKPSEVTDEELPPDVELDRDPMRALLKRSLKQADAAPEKPLLKEVQRKLRVRSNGKFYGDGWSTAQQKISYALIATIMLVVIVIAYFALGPTGISK